VTAISTTAALAYPWFAPIAVPFAGLVSYSRVALRVHHASDVVAGVALGFAGALAAHAVL
jgi:membrane-associated phospholipid phosphatase